MRHFSGPILYRRREVIARVSPDRTIAPRAGYAGAASLRAPAVTTSTSITPRAGLVGVAGKAAFGGSVSTIAPRAGYAGAFGAAATATIVKFLTFEEFLAADDREPIVLVELHPSVIATGFVPDSGNPIVSGQTLGALKNNATGCRGIKFTAVASVQLMALGRWRVAGNAQTHTLRLMQETAGVLTELVNVSIDMSTGTAGAFKYEFLSPSVQLVAGETYHIYSSETNGGDQWYDDTTTISLFSAFGGASSVQQTTCGSASYTAGATAGPNHSYGPVSALFGQTYRLTFPHLFATDQIPGGVYRRVDSVRQNEVDLTHGTNPALPPGAWWYDEATDTLYVRTTNDAAPDTFSLIQVFVTLFAATTGLVLDQVTGNHSTGVYYRPLIVGGVSSVDDVAPDPIVGGNLTMAGQIDLMNESQSLPKLFAVDGVWLWRNKLVSLYYGGRALGKTLPRESFYPIGTVLISGVAADE